MTSHIDKIIAVGERMVGNLNAMGVSASFNDGALTLADKILDVPGLVLDTNISWIASETQVSINQKVTFTGKLFGYYNDTGEDNVDFCGIIKNAPLKLYKGETLIDTTNTDNAGEFAFEFIPTTAGSFQFKVVCEDGTNFNGCTSSIITISVGSFDGFSLEMTDGSDILSYADEQASAGSQYCTVTCQLLNGQSPVAVSGVDVVFGVYKSSDDSLIGSVSTVQTDVNGQADYTYSSHGYGDVYIKAECIFVSKTYSIIDAKYYASNSRIDNEGVPYNNDRKIFSSTYTLSVGDEIHFRLKTDPTIAIMGIGSSQGSDCTIMKNTDGTFTLYRNWGTNGQTVNAREGFYSSQEWIIVPTLNDSSNPSHKFHIYQGNTSTEVDWWGMKLQIKKIRIDKFYNYDFEVEVYVL